MPAGKFYKKAKKTAEDIISDWRIQNRDYPSG